MNVLVVGGAGYIGAHVTLALLERGHRPTVFDNLSTGWEENLFEDAHFTLGDLLTGDALAEALAAGAFDAVIHLAALKSAGDSMNEPERYARHNVWGSLRLIEKTLAAGAPLFLFSSSAAVYGEPRRLPIDESHPLEPANYYGFTKLQVERHLQWHSRLRNLRFASLRYFNAAGYDPQGRVSGVDRDPQNLFPVVMEAVAQRRDAVQVFGDDYDTRDGSCVRDYVHVTDLAEAHVLALEHMARENRDLILNLGSETGHTVLEVIAAAEKAIGKPVPHVFAVRREGDPAALVASSAKAREVLGWKPRFSDLETMLAHTWQVYEKRL